MVKKMKKIIDKRNYIILGIIILLLIFIVVQMFTKEGEYSYNYDYFDHYIVVKIYEDQDVFDDIDSIYKKYDEALNGENDQLLEEIIAYGKEIYDQTDGYVDISKGKLTSGEVTEFETKIDDLSVEMKDDIDITDIISSYATNEVISYLKENNIDEYLISDDGDISAGNYYTDGRYTASISYEDAIIDIVSLENESMITRSKDEDTQSYMVNPIESEITQKYDTVVVIADDVNEATMLANALYLMDREDGEQLITEYDAAALWYTDGETYSLNFEQYTGD